MICPKCGAEQGEDNLECMRCGVIFAKLKPEHFVQSHSRSNTSQLSVKKAKQPIPIVLICVFIIVFTLRIYPALDPFSNIVECGGDYWEKVLTKILFVSIGIYLFVILRIKENKKEYKQFENLPMFLNGKVTYGFFSVNFKGVQAGFAYTIKVLCFYNKGGNSSRQMKIFFTRRTPLNMVVLTRMDSQRGKKAKTGAAESGSRRWWLRLSSLPSINVNTGDAEFDSRFFVSCEGDTLSVLNYLKKKDVFVHISALLLRHFYKLHITKNMVKVETLFIQNEDITFLFDKARLTETINSLAFLAKSLH